MCIRDRVSVPVVQRGRRGVLRHGRDHGPGSARHAVAGTAARRRLRPAARQQPLGAGQRAAHRRRLPPRRRLVHRQRAVPGRNKEELLMLGVPNHSRPMVRVETLVLVVTAWIVGTANGPWWSAVSQGRDWSQPGNWLFLGCCFVMLVGLHFAIIAPLSFRRIARPLLTLLVMVSAGAAWYMSNFSVMLDPTMVQNVLRTVAHEARDLLNLH